MKKLKNTMRKIIYLIRKWLEIDKDLSSVDKEIVELKNHNEFLHGEVFDLKKKLNKLLNTRKNS